MGFADMERTLRAAAGDSAGLDPVPLDIADLFAAGVGETLSGLDVVYGNCGPATALLMGFRAAADLPLRLIREVRTLGWVGYAFQERIAESLGRPDDICVHVSDYARGVWAQARPPGRETTFYPMIAGEPEKPVTPPRPTRRRRGLRAGYFGRVDREKGYHFLPAIVARLAEAGWPISRVDVCGPADDTSLAEQVAAELKGMGVASQSHGPLDHGSSLALMGAVDVVLFPTLSSIEALGRVIVEARITGRPVFASDFCGGHDLLQPGYRLPLALDGPVTGSSADPFPIGRIELGRWTPPPTDATVFRPQRLAPYRDGMATMRALIEGHPDPGAAPREATAPLRMNFHWEDLPQRSAADWCDAVVDGVRREYRDRADLVDLGGATKRAIIGAGFHPRVTFRPPPGRAR